MVRHGIKIICRGYEGSACEDVGVDTANGIETLKLVFDITDSAAWANMIQTERIRVDIHE